MTTETRYTYSREEIPQALAPALICETFGGKQGRHRII